MPQPCKIEIFDREMNFRSVGFRHGYILDYLTLERTTVTLKAIGAQRGDFARFFLHAGSGLSRHCFRHSDRRKDSHFKPAPLLSLFDLTVTYDRTDLQTGSLEDFIASVISGLYITNPDTLERIPMSVTTTSSTPSALNIKSNVHEFYDIITKALTMYGIVVKAVFDPATKAINVTAGDGGRVIEADLDNIIDKILSSVTLTAISTNPPISTRIMRPQE